MPTSFKKLQNCTRNVRIDQHANIVDLVLTNDESLISEIVHCAPLGASDHDVLIFQLNIPKKKKKNKKEKRFNLAKGNYKKNEKRLKKYKLGHSRESRGGRIVGKNKKRNIEQYEQTYTQDDKNR